MTVRVWMQPSELGEQGYCVDIAEATDYTERTLGPVGDRHRYLVLLRDPVPGQPDADLEVARVPAGRWDMCVILQPDDPKPKTRRKVGP